MASTRPTSTAPSSPFLTSSTALLPDDEHTLLPTASTGDRRHPEPYTASLANLPGARKLAPRGTAPRRCPPRLVLPLIFIALALGASLAFVKQSTRDRLASYLAFTPEESRRIASAFYEPPPWPLDPAGIAIRDAAEGEHTVTAIVVHGLGDRGDGRPYTWALPRRFPYVRWVAPTADFLNVTVRDGATTRAWFDIKTFDDIWGDEDVVGYMHSQQQLNQLIDVERKRMIDAGKEPRIVLLGFSQGGVMSLLATLTAPTRDRIEAAVVMSSYLPLLESFDKLFSRKARETPLLWVHGRADPYLTYANAELSLARLTSAPISMRNVAFRGYDKVLHGWSNAMLDDVADWFADHVPQAKGSRDAIDAEEEEEAVVVAPAKSPVATPKPDTAVERLDSLEANGALVPARAARRFVQRRRTPHHVFMPV